MPPRRSRTHHPEGPWHPLVLLALVWEFLGGLVLLGLICWGSALALAFMCMKTCKPFGPEYLPGPALILINILVLLTTHNEILHAMDETLSINRLLYCQAAKAVPVLALFAYTLMVASDWLWLYLLILLPFPLLFALGVAMAAKYTEWAQKRQKATNDEERPLLTGEVHTAAHDVVIHEDPPGATPSGEESVARG